MIPASADKERVLVAALREGNEAGRRDCYEQFYRYLAAVCSRYVPTDEDVKDLLQDVFLKIFTRFDRFTYRGAGSLQAWMYQIAVNESLMFLRSNKKRWTLQIEEVEVPDDNEEYPDDPDVEDIPLHVLLEMVRKLPERYRTVFNLYVFEDRRHKDIASLLNIKETSSASNLCRAKALLAKWIKEYHKTRPDGR